MALIPGLGDRHQAGVNGVLGVRGIRFIGIGEIGRAHQPVVALLPCRKIRDVMEHQHPLAKAIGAHFESGAVGGERIGANGPGFSGCCGCLDEPMLVSLRSGRIESDLFVVAFVVVEDDFEHPCVGRKPGRVDDLPGGCVAVGRAVAVLDALQVAIGRPHAVALVGLAAIDVIVALCRILVDDGIALVVVALADEPGEDAGGIGRIGDA